MISSRSWSFTTAGAQCPCTVWPDTAQPSVPSANDSGAINLGVKFTTDVNGWVAGIRFYKGAANSGAHIGSLWSSSGTLLGQVTFTSESPTGWQEAYFSSPFPVAAGTTFVASYFAPHGGLVADPAKLASAGVADQPLYALQSAARGGDRGQIYAR